MHIFLTGGTGFIGTEVVAKLIAGGHSVLGLARSDESAQKLREAGADALSGSITDIDVLKEGADSCDGVIHLAYDSDFNRYTAAIEDDLTAIAAMGEALGNTGKAFVGTSGTLMVPALGRPATEEDPATPGTPRGPAENAVIALAEKGVRSCVVRLAPCVHTANMQGLASVVAGIARAKGVSAYIDDGENVWPAVYMPDAAELFCKAVESADAGTRLHAVGEEGIRTRDIAEAIGEGLHIPVASLSGDEAREHFGMFYDGFRVDNPCSSDLTKQRMSWSLSQQTLLDSLMASFGKPLYS